MLKRNDVALIVVDLQERMMPVIDRNEKVTDNCRRLIAGCRELNIPILVSEQYPRGLGTTVPAIREALGEQYRPIEKTAFSCCGDMSFMSRFESLNRKQALVCGVETHVCVYQTARDLANLGWEVEVAADAVGSRSQENREIALGRLTRHGVELTSVEMALFDLMKDAEIDEFKAISSIVK